MSAHVCEGCSQPFCTACDGGGESSDGMVLCSDCLSESERPSHGPPPYDAATATGMYDREDG